MRRTLLVLLIALPALVVDVGHDGTPAQASSWPVRAIHFPVEGKVSYSDTWGAPRGGGTRTHEGTDIMGHRLQPLLAARDGVVAWTRTDGNNMLALRDPEGWEYWYIHINNDTPGTDDGANPREWILAPNVERGTYVLEGQVIAYLGDSGNAESTSPHLHFEIHQPGGQEINPYPSLRVAHSKPRLRSVGVAQAAGGGHWVLDQFGGVHAFGGAPHHGQPAFGWDIARDIEPAPDGNGYVVLDGWGGVHGFGSAAAGVADLVGPYFPGHDVARGVSLMPKGDGFVVVDGWGGVHRSGSATAIPRLYDPYWPGWDIVRDVAVSADGTGYVVLDGWGGVHRTGTTKESLRGLEPSYWTGWDIAREIVMAPDGKGYVVLDGWGGLHGRGSMAGITSSIYRPGANWTSLSVMGTRAVVSDGKGTSKTFSL